MNSILKVLSTFLFGISTACFGQLLIPDMPLSSGQVAATGTMPQNQPSVQPFVTPVVQSQPTPIVVTPALPPIMPTQMPTVAVPTTMPVTTITPPAQPFIPQVIPQAPPQPALPPVQPQNLFPQTAPIVPNLLAPPITPSSQLQFVVPDEEDKDKKNIYLNFENSDLSSFVNYMAELKNLNLIPDQTLEAAKISLTIREPLSVDGAWNVFLTVLDTAGFAIVQTGDIWKVLPKDKKLNQPLPAYINVAADKLPDNDITIRYVFFLTNIQVGDIKTLLESMLSSPNVLVDQPQLNAFIITDKSLNIKAAVKLIQELDQEGLPEEVTVLPLKRANAVDVKALLDSLIVKPDVNPIARLLGKVTEGTASYFSPTTRIIPEERTNSLILLGNKKSNQKIIDFITNQIDTELKDTESPLHIYELQYADATAVMDILKEVTAAPESVNGSQASKFGSIRGGVKYFKEMKFKVDKDGNRLIVSSTDKQDWKLLEKTIADLDKPQPQIVIESLIVLVDVKDTMELGGSIRSKKHGALGINTDFQASMLNSPSLEMDSSSNPVSLMGNLLTQLTANQGAALLSFGKQASVWAVLKILKQLTNTSILSQPSITVANKTQATIEIGTQARVVQATVNAGGGATNTGYQTVSATTKLNITPQINADGLVRLDVNLNIDQFLDTTYLSNTTKEVKTNVTVADGQVLVLGGFVKTSTQETTYKVPILGDIPILGWFFKSQRRELHKEYTFVFMAPTIIKPRQAPGSGLYTKMKFHQATDDIENAIETKRVKDPIHNWFFNPQKENYSHKVIDFANARYQPTTVDIKNDPYYRSNETIKDYKPDQAIVQNREKITPEPEATQEPAQVFPNVEQPAEPIATPTEPQPIQLPIIPEPVQPPAPLVTQPPVLQPRLQPLPQTPAIPAQQPRPQLIKRPKLPPTIPEEQKELAALEQEIMQRRQALKANMAAPAQKSIQNTKPALIDKRKTLKDFITQSPQTASQSNQRESNSFTQRNRLKDFLANNPAIALNNNSSDKADGKDTSCC